MEAARLELHAQTATEGALAAAGRTGDEHYAHRVLATVALVDFLGYLHYLLFLEGFRNLYELACLPVQAGLVHVAHIAQPHNPVPVESFCEDFEGLRLLAERCQPGRGVTVRHTQQHTAPVWGQTPDFKVTRARDQGIIIVVSRILEGVVVHVNVAAGLQKLDFVLVPEFAEHAYGFGSLHLVAAERNVAGDEFLHPDAYRSHIGVKQGSAVALVDAAEIALGDGPAHHNLAFREEVAGRLVEQEAEGAAIHVASAVGTVVKKFHVPVVEYSEFQAFAHIVDLGAYNVERLVKFEVRNHFKQGGAFLEFQGASVVFAINLEHL